MELKQNKPIHMKCPKCGHDFSMNGNKIVNELQFYKKKASTLKNQLTKLKANGEKNTPKYKRVVEALSDCNMTLQALNRLNRNLSENSELEKYKVYKSLVEAEIGKEKSIKLIMEAEDSLIYRDYDMAVQRHNNFSNV